MDIVGTIKTSEIQENNLKIINAMDYQGKEIIKLDDNKWYWYEEDLVQMDINGGPIQALINQLKEKD